MSQPQMKLSECNRCKSTGFPGVMIGFIQGGVKKDGKVFWNLVNKDNTPHSHLSPRSPTPAQARTNGTTVREDMIHQSHLENVACWTARRASNENINYDSFHRT